MIEFEFDNPLRATDWRWQRAGIWLSSKDRFWWPKAKHDGGAASAQWMRDAIRFREQMLQADDPTDHVKLKRKYPALYYANMLSQQQDNPTRYAIEAYLLASETNQSIGFRMGCGEDVVDAYESLFFDVREKLRNHGYILNTVIGPAIHRGLSDRSYDVLWKLLGFMAGPHVVDAVISKFPEQSWAPDPQAVGAFWQEAAVGVMKMKATQAALSVGVNSQTHLALLDIFNKYVEIERTTESQGQAREAFMENIGSMMQSLPYTVAGYELTSEEDHRYLHYDPDTGREHRMDELVLQAAGNPIPERKQLMPPSFPEID